MVKSCKRFVRFYKAEKGNSLFGSKYLVFVRKGKKSFEKKFNRRSDAIKYMKKHDRC